MRILVTNLNRPPGYSIVCALSPFFEKVYGTMRVEPSFLAKLSTKVAKVFYAPFPQANESGDHDEALSASYIQTILDICTSNEIGVVFPCQDEEILLLAKNKSLFSEHNIIIIANDPEKITIASSKEKVADISKIVGFPTPETFLCGSDDEEIFNKADEIGYPLIVKGTPALAAAGVRLVGSRDELKDQLGGMRGNFEKILLQEHIPGNKERSLNLLFDSKSNLVLSFGLKKFRYIHPSWSTSVESFEPESQLLKAAEIAKYIGLTGFVSIQTKLDERDGIYKLIEMNPRFGNNSRLLFRSGINLPKLVIDQALGKDLAPTHYPVMTAVSVFDDILAFFVFLAHKRKLKNNLSSYIVKSNPSPTISKMLASYYQTYKSGPFVDDYTANMLLDPLFLLEFVRVVIKLESNAPQHWEYFIPWGELPS